MGPVFREGKSPSGGFSSPLREDQHMRLRKQKKVVAVTLATAIAVSGIALTTAGAFTSLLGKSKH